MTQQKTPAATGANKSSGQRRLSEHQITTISPASQPVSSLSTRTPIYVGGKIVGTVVGQVFFKRVSGSRHQLRRPPAWAFDIASLVSAEQAGAVIIEIQDSDTDTVFRATIANVWRHGHEFERGHGRQIYLTLPYWKEISKGSIDSQSDELFGEWKPGQPQEGLQ